MEELVINTTIFLEIEDAAAFGGTGSVGYSEVSSSFSVTSDKPDIFEDNAYEHIKRYIKLIASELGISPDKIRTIGKKEYQKNTEED